MIAGPILVTGASGFIGSHLVRSLVASGAAVTGLCWSRNPSRDLPGLTCARADLRDPEAMAALFAGAPFRTVFHLAAEGVHQENDGGLSTVDVNTLAAFSLARAALSSRGNRGVERFVYCGSAFEYQPQSSPISGSAPAGSETLYGAAKAAGWLLLDYLARMEGLPLVTVRPFTAFGPGESCTKLIPYVIGNALRRQPIQVTAGTQIRDYLYISDVVDALRLAAEKGMPGDVFNVGSGPEGARTVRSIVEAILELTGAPASLASFGAAIRSRPDSPYLVSDPSRARAQLGWRQKVSFEAGLKESIAWYQSQWRKEGSLHAHS